MTSSEILSKPLRIVSIDSTSQEVERNSFFNASVKAASIQFLKIESEFESFETLKDAESKGPRVDDLCVLRLFKKAQTEALPWLGAKGQATSEVAILGIADAILLRSGEPAQAIGALPQAMVSALAHSRVTFDSSGAGLIIGVNEETRSFAAGIARLGLKKILLVDLDDERAKQMALVLRRRLFGVEIQALSRSLLTQLASEASIAVNLVEKSEGALMEDISYLNFLRSNGLFIDWTGATAELDLTEEIKNAGAQVFSAEKIRFWRDSWVLEIATRLKAEQWFDFFSTFDQKSHSP